MSTAIANAMTTGSPLSDEQLDCAYRFFKALSSTLSFAGPKFADARLEAMGQGNSARNRLVTQRRRREQEKTDAQLDEDLEEIR